MRRILRNGAVPFLRREGTDIVGVRQPDRAIRHESGRTDTSARTEGRARYFPEALGRAWRSGEVVGAAEVDYVCLQLRCHRRELQLNSQGKRCHRQHVAEEEGAGTR